MIPTFFDLRTGKTAKGDNMSFFWVLVAMNFEYAHRLERP